MNVNLFSVGNQKELHDYIFLNADMPTRHWGGGEGLVGTQKWKWELKSNLQG